MRRFSSTSRLFIIAGLLICGCAPARIEYPVAMTVDQVDEFHGVSVPDPYRWMEEPDTPELKAWINAENKVTFDYLGRIPQRRAFEARLTKLWDYEKYGLPMKEGGRYFFSKNDGLQNQDVLYTTPSLDAEPAVLLDPNLLSKDGTIALATRSVSRDGRLLAYGLAEAGSDWNIIKVREVDSKRDRPDEIRWVKFSSPAWDHEGEGFYYSRYDEPKEGAKLQSLNYYQKLYYHALGQPQSADRLIYERPDQKEWGFSGGVTDDGRYLVIHVSEGTERKNRFFYRDLSAGNAPVVELLNDFDAEYDFIDNDGPVFWFRTDLDAPRGKVIAIDTRRPERSHWKVVIPESEDTLQGVSLVHHTFFALYLHDAASRVRLFDEQGRRLRDLELPGLGSAGGFGGKRVDTETFYSYTSFATPRTVYRYDAVSGRSTLHKAPRVDFNPDDFETRQVFYSSKDGTRVPMFIVHKKGLPLDGNNPTYLYGYGGFNISLTPSFSPSNVVWLEKGGVFAMPNLRGGGEYGKEWHDAGRLLNKQNVFDDFIAAAQWLIDNKYTRREKLGIGGGSNGGLLVGACLTQRPDLFGAAVPQVGVLDMLRFHKFTIGWAWKSDYGSPEDAEQFKTLYAYSPLHNVKSGRTYPATLIITGDHDDRVVPAHSFKFAAALQKAQAGSNPVLIRVETRAGHGAGKPTAFIIQEHADRWAFLAHVLGLEG